jgi:tryptophanyl-tRNA synthetase
MEDDERLEEIRRDYASGRMMSGEIKKELIDCITVRPFPVFSHF